MSKLVEIGRAPRVLLVEDCDGDAMLFRRTLMRACPDAELRIAHTAESGLVLLQQASSTGSDPLPDLIVTDLNLPGMGGVEFIRTLKNDYRFRRIPCLVLSSSSDIHDIEAAYDAFASGYLTKPDSIEDYAVMIARLSAYWFTLMQIPPTSAGPRRIAAVDTGFQHSSANLS